MKQSVSVRRKCAHNQDQCTHKTNAPTQQSEKRGGPGFPPWAPVSPIHIHIDIHQSNKQEKYNQSSKQLVENRQQFIENRRTTGLIPKKVAYCGEECMYIKTFPTIPHSLSRVSLLDDHE
mmetsp:Transcript_35007/g.56653  ORF Transcript_35007/g.56653 Transcript_35007/m.56653 type:complete len:120 (-) Transcript_35007:776-1135(-)